MKVVYQYVRRFGYVHILTNNKVNILHTILITFKDKGLDMYSNDPRCFLSDIH